MFAAKFQQLRHARHGAVFVHNFTDYARGSEPRDARKVHAGLSLPCAHQNSAIPRPQGKHMARPRQILRFGLRINRRENGDRPVRGADARGHANARIDRLAKGRSVHRSIDCRHQGQVQLVAALFRQRQANEPTAIFGHEVNGVRRDFLRRHCEIAFVLAVLVVHQDNHASLANLFDSFLDRGEIGYVSHRTKNIAEVGREKERRNGLMR